MEEITTGKARLRRWQRGTVQHAAPLLGLSGPLAGDVPGEHSGEHSSRPCLREIPELGHQSGLTNELAWADNRLIRGDNLLAMEALLPDFAGRVKCIYIDPPYNTGNQFSHYRDDVESGHWLAAMAARLHLMRELLRPDGVLLVSIGDDEAAYLKVLLDDIFGRNNYCGTLVWEKKRKPSFLNRNLNSVTEFILAYARDGLLAGPFAGGQTAMDKRYPLNNTGNGLRVLRFDAGAVEFDCPDGVYPPQDMSQGAVITHLLDAVEVRAGRNVDAFRLEGEWRYSQASLDALMQAGERITISKVPFRPNHVQSRQKSKKMHNLLSAAHYPMSTYEDATQESRALFGEAAAFDYPKPERLIHVLLNAVTQPGDWVLDAYAGSGTTGAVAHKMGRRWLMIEQGDQVLSHIHLRLKKVADGQDAGGVTALTQWPGGGGFRFFETELAL
jgi:adenine-specific DNA-methyltransferase